MVLIVFDSDNYIMNSFEILVLENSQNTMWRLGTIAIIFAGSLTVLYLLANWTAQVSLNIVIIIPRSLSLGKKHYNCSIEEFLILHLVLR